MPTPEELARHQIDALLQQGGWIIQDYKKLDLSAGKGIAIREVPTSTGPCDYLLLIDRQSVGVIEAKKQGKTLSGVAEQSGRYAICFSSRRFKSVKLSNTNKCRERIACLCLGIRDSRMP